MKYSLIIVVLCIGISHGFFGNIGQGIGNIGKEIETGINEVGNKIDEVGEGIENITNEVKETVEEVVTRILNIANGIQFAANFLWDNVFSPTFDMIIAGGQLFIDGNFGAIGSVIGNATALPENPLEDKYAQLVAQLKSNIHHLYEQLFLLEQETLKALQNGELNFEERIRAFHEKLNAIEKQINEWAEVAKYELEVYALTAVGDWTEILNQYKQNIDSVAQSIEKMFEKLTQNLMKNILDGVANVIPNAQNTIEKLKSEGLLSFFRQ